MVAYLRTKRQGAWALGGESLPGKLRADHDQTTVKEHPEQHQPNRRHGLKRCQRRPIPRVEGDPIPEEVEFALVEVVPVDEERHEKGAQTERGIKSHTASLV